MIVRELLARFGVKTDPKGIKQADQGLQKLVNGAKVAATAFASIKAIGVFKGIAERTAALGDSIDKVSSKLGVNAQALQELRFAADQTGVSQQALDVGIQRFIRRASEAAQGTGVAKDALAELGVQLKDNQGNLRPVDELLGDVAEGFKGTKTDADRVRLAFKLFDTEGVNLVNTLKGGRSELDALRKKARETGGILDTELIKTSVEFTDTASELNLTFQGVRNVIAKALLPAFVSMMKTFIVFIKRNRELIQQRLGAVLRGIGRGIATVARFFIDAADAARDWIATLSPAQKKLLGIGAIAAAVAILLALPGGAIIALGILVGLLIEDFQRWREGGQSVIGDLVAALDGLLMEFPVLRETLIAIGDFFALTFGTLQDVVFSFIQFWIDVFSVGPLEAVQNLGQNLLMSFEGVFDALGGIIETAVAFWKEAIFGFAQSVIDRVTGVGRKVRGFFRGIIGGNEGTADAPGSRAAGLAPVARGLGQVATAGAIAPAAQVAGPGGAGGARVINAPQTRIDVAVKANDGMDEAALADLTARKIDEALERQNRNAIRALTPAMAQ